MSEESEVSVSSFKQLLPSPEATIFHPNWAKRLLRSLSFLFALVMATTVVGIVAQLLQLEASACQAGDAAGAPGGGLVSSLPTAYLQFHAVGANVSYAKCANQTSHMNQTSASAGPFDDASIAPPTYIIGGFVGAVIFFFAKIYGIRSSGAPHAIGCCCSPVTWIIDHIISGAAPVMLSFVQTLQHDDDTKVFAIFLTSTMQVFSLFLIASLVYSFVFFVYAKCLFCCLPCCRKCDMHKWMIHTFAWLLLVAALLGVYTQVHHYSILATYYYHVYESDSPPTTAGLLTTDNTTDHSTDQQQDFLSLGGLLLNLLQSLSAWNPATLSGGIGSLLHVLAYTGCASFGVSTVLTLLDSLPMVSKYLRERLGIDAHWADDDPTKKTDGLRKRMLEDGLGDAQPPLNVSMTR